MNRPFVALIVVLLFGAFGHQTAAQSSLTFSLFERYLESFREQAGIPGMSGLVLRENHVVWERGFGRQDVESNVAAFPDTPYPIQQMSQAIGATLLLDACVERGTATLNDPVRQWVPDFPDASTTLAHLLAHIGPTGAYRYDPARFAALTAVIEACTGRPYTQLVAEEFARLGMFTSVPGTALAAPTASDLVLGAPTLQRFGLVLARTATPYRVDVRNRPFRSDPTSTRANAATGLVTTVRDLAQFDAGLQGVLLSGEILARAWTPPAAHLPTGLGWFVQSFRGERIVWQFGVAPDAYSALYIKVPSRQLTFILLANSDGLVAPYGLEAGDVMTSLFARLFLLLFVP